VTSTVTQTLIMESHGQLQHLFIYSVNLYT